MKCTERRIPYTDEELFELLKTRTYKQVSEITGVKPSTIQMSLKRHGFIKPKIDRPKDKECPVCGELFAGDKRKVFCSKSCCSYFRRVQQEDRINSTNLVDKDITLKKLFKRDNGICYICGVETDFNDFEKTKRNGRMLGDNYPTIEHVIPIKHGGLHSWDNVKLACWNCNKKKYTKSLEVI